MPPLHSAAVSLRRRVALLIETSNGYARGLVRGAVRYADEHGGWSLDLPEMGRGGPPPAWLREWRGDGLIARIENQRIAKAVASAKKPAIDVSAARLLPTLPWVETQDDAIAALALAHLRERGFPRVVFCGDSRFNWSRWREAAFLAQAQAGGAQALPSFDLAAHRAGAAALDQFVRQLDKPVGVMACYDLLGQRLIDACRRTDIAVPDEVAVVGVDDDELVCQLCAPKLTSVAPDAERTGYAAARALDLWLEGRRSDVPDETRVPPRGLIARQSTDADAIPDREVARALHFIRNHATAGINVADVLRAVPLSRRALEMRFVAALGRSPHQEILRARLARVRELLRDTDLSLAMIAQRTGYEHAEYLSVVWKRETGMTPSEFRKRAR